jgi:cell division protein FtsZ
MMGTGVASGENRARLAAEAAVASPLLEDINLQGAQGILVNVTAGLDLSIGEFEEVGRIVKEFASEDATVVVGTVIDPEMSNDIRVTVVATGLGREHAVRAPPTRNERFGDNGRAGEPSMRVVKPRPAAGGADYSAFDPPAVRRVPRAVGDGLRPSEQLSEELLDIPAFLRRQAD